MAFRESHKLRTVMKQLREEKAVVAKQQRQLGGHDMRQQFDFVFSENGVHINGIESFWSYAKRRHQKFNGLRRTAFPTFLKETEFRFNTRDQYLYKILFGSCRLNPLRR